MRWRKENTYDDLVEAAAQRYQVPAALIKGVMAQESAFRADAFRDEPRIADASRGLMQVLERTAHGLGYDGAADGLFDPETSIDLGAKLLAQNFKQANGDWDAAISAYNAGFSSDRPWDAKRYTTKGHPQFGRMVNEDYVKRVRGNWTYFQWGTVPKLASIVALVGGAWLLYRYGVG